MNYKEEIEKILGLIADCEAWNEGVQVLTAKNERDIFTKIQSLITQSNKEAVEGFVMWFNSRVPEEFEIDKPMIDEFLSQDKPSQYKPSESGGK